MQLPAQITGPDMEGTWVPASFPSTVPLCSNPKKKSDRSTLTMRSDSQADDRTSGWQRALAGSAGPMATP